VTGSTYYKFAMEMEKDGQATIFQDCWLKRGYNARLASTITPR